MFSKKYKIDSKNRKFLTEWTKQYCFTRLERVEAVLSNKKVPNIK